MQGSLSMAYRLCRWMLLALGSALLMACTVISAVDTVASVTIDAVGAVVKAVIP